MEKEFLNTTLKYENDQLFRIDKRSKKWRCCNKVKPNSDGYINIEINGKNFPLHRLVYLYHNPDWDIFDGCRDNSIDHMNGNKLDNKIENLKNVTHSENKQNQTTYAGKEIKGYLFCNDGRNKPWRAFWNELGKQKQKGFKTALEAKEHRALMTQHYYQPCRDLLA